jgi:hypothetical protein
MQALPSPQPHEMRSVLPCFVRRSNALFKPRLPTSPLAVLPYPVLRGVSSPSGRSTALPQPLVRCAPAGAAVLGATRPPAGAARGPGGALPRALDMMRHCATMPPAMVAARSPGVRCRPRTPRHRSSRARAGRACPSAAGHPHAGRPINGAGSCQAPDARPGETGQVLIVSKRLSGRKGSSGSPASLLSPPMSPSRSRGVSASAMGAPRLSRETGYTGQWGRRPCRTGWEHTRGSQELAWARRPRLGAVLHLGPAG